MSLKKVNILILEDELFDYENIPNEFSVVAFSNKIKDFSKFEIIISRLRFSLKKNFLIKFKNLKYIITFTTALDHVDLSYCNQKKIIVSSLRNIKKKLHNVSSTAEHAWMLTLLVYRKFNEIEFTKRKKPVGFQIKDKVVGIVGMGRIGKMLHRYSLSFGCKVLYSDLKPIKVSNAKQVSIINLFKKSDIIIICITSDQINFKCIDSYLINTMKKNSILINISRNWVIDEYTTLNSLKLNKIYGYGTDFINYDNLFKVFNTKNISKIRKKYNYISTNHSGGNNTDAIKYVENKLLLYFFNNIYKK